MASARDNNIVIECSPYGDSETEIVNLKTPSFELIPMGNILDFGNSIDIIITLSSIFVVVLVFLFIGSKINNYSGTFYMKDIINPFLKVTYLVLFIIGLVLLSTKSSDSGYLSSVYIVFGVAFIIAFILRVIKSYDQINTGLVVNVLLPGFIIKQWNSNSLSFTALFVVYIIILSIVSIFSKSVEVFSVKTILGGYCLLQGMNYFIISTYDDTPVPYRN